MISDLEKTILRIAVEKDLTAETHEDKIKIWNWAVSLLKKFN